MENFEGLIKKVIGWVLLGFGLIAWGIFIQKVFWIKTWNWNNISNGQIMEIFHLFVVPFIVGAILLIGSDRKRN
jgi:hypothetical protein